MSGQPDTRARVERPRTLTNGWTSRSPSPGEITARTVKKAETMSRIVELEKPGRTAGALSPASPTARRATRAHGLVSRPRPGSGPPLGRGALPRMRHDGGRDARPTSRPGSAGVDGDGAGGEPFGRVRARRARIGGLPNDRAGAVDLLQIGPAGNPAGNSGVRAGAVAWILFPVA